MELHHLIAFNVALLAAIASPGPAMLFLLRMAISGGWRVGFATGCGLAAMAATWTLVALLGLDVVFTLFPWTYATFKIGGAAYLIWIAIQTWRHARDAVAETETPSARAFVGGALVNLANPKAVLFAAAVLVVVFPTNLSAAEAAVVFANHMMLEVLCYAAMAAAITHRTIRSRYLRAKPALDRVAALVLGGLGVRLLTER